MPFEVGGHDWSFSRSNWINVCPSNELDDLVGGKS